MGLNLLQILFPGDEWNYIITEADVDWRHPQLATECELIIIARLSDFTLGNHFASLPQCILEWIAISSSRGMDPLLSIGLDFAFITPFSVLVFSQVEQLSWLQMVVVGLERPKLQLVASQSPSAHSHAQCALASQDSPWIKHIPRLLLVETRPSPNQELLA